MDVMKKLRDELAELDRELKLVLPKMIREAASQGDLSENAEYEAAKQRQVWVNARMGNIRSRLQALSLINFNDIPTDRVGFGSTVTIEDVDTGEQKTFQLVHPEAVNPNLGMISMESPIGHALSGKQIEESLTIRLPSGAKEYVVVKLTTIHDAAD
jgi:transcription elongation factor GreA